MGDPKIKLTLVFIINLIFCILNIERQKWVFSKTKIFMDTQRYHFVGKFRIFFQKSSFSTELATENFSIFEARDQNVFHSHFGHFL